MTAYSPAMVRALKAREAIAKRDRWFAHIIFAAPIIERTDIKTACTNGTKVFINPAFIMGLTGEQVEGLLFHEFCHIILKHVQRCGFRDPMTWNIACDGANANPMTLRRGWPLPTGAIDIPEIANMTCEAAYKWLIDKQEADKAAKQQDQDQDQDADQDQSNEADAGEGYQQGSEPMEEPTAEELKDFEAKLDRLIDSATKKATAGGYMSKDIERLLDGYEEPAPLDYNDVLEDMIRNNRDIQSRTYMRPNRRYISRDINLPGFARDQIARLVFCIDVSSSMDKKAIAEIKSTVARFMDQGDITNATIISVDTDIRAMGDVTTSQEILDFDLNARQGGTHFDSAMQEVGELTDCVGCVFLTDMETSSFGPEPDMPVVWINWGREQQSGSPYYPPYGRQVMFKR
jgi:predicted metal-dependent peptidase